MHRVLTTQLDRKFVLSAAKNKTSGLRKNYLRLVDGHLALNQKTRDHLSGIYSEFNVGKPTGISLVVL